MSIRGTGVITYSGNLATYKTIFTHNSSEIQKFLQIYQEQRKTYTPTQIILLFGALPQLTCKRILLLKMDYYIPNKQQLPEISKAL